MLAEVLWRGSTEKRREAAKEFDQVLELARAKDKLDFFEAQSAGWAAFRLSFDPSRDGRAMLAEAERYFVDALSTKKENPNSSDAICVQFNLALTALSSGRIGLALREYDRVLELAGKLQRALHRGVVGRAREDLEQLMLDRPQFTEERYVRRLLETLGHDYTRKEEQGPEGSLAVEAASEDIVQASNTVYETTVPAKS
jgi:tetratricopeptide (TPR) repeat protein